MSAPFGPNDRREQASEADERENLVSYLNFQRDTLRWKAGGLAVEQLAARPVPTTGMSLLGLVRHMAEVESGWGNAVLGQPRKLYYRVTASDPIEWDVAGADQAMVDESYANWEQAVADFDAVIAARELTHTFVRDETLNIRSLLAHMIEEYARHNGHADLLREAIDGQTGE
jgi:uncharacterized damage-inducible protein DinB